MTAPGLAGPDRWLAEVPLAHRGLHGDGVPENSLAAFRAARASRVGVELDVRLAADGVPVVFHDRGLDRMTGRPGPLAELGSADLARLRLAGSAQGVPTLATVLAALDPTPAMIEVKADAVRVGPLEAAVAAVLADHDGPACVASFNPLSLRWFRRHAPAVTRVLAARPTVVELRGRELCLANLQSVALVEPAAVSYDVAGLRLPAVRRLRELGATVVTWTVRTPPQLAAARAAADNVIFEDLPVTLVRP